MKLSDFKDLINELPFKNQSFDIKKANWKSENQKEIIERIFGENQIITLNRFDLFNSSSNIHEFVIKTLMWGYPTKGRGRNIDILLKEENFNKLIETLNLYIETDVTLDRLESDIKRIDGLGLSAMTKFLHFLNTKIDNNTAVILDLQIIDAINLGRFEEFNFLNGIRYNNAIKKYGEFLYLINDLSKQLMVKPDQIEMFLFIFGKSLSELKGEECYDYD